MIFADAQSMLQLTIGLNLGYFAFRELRAPSIARRERELRDGNAAIAMARERFERAAPLSSPADDEENELFRALHMQLLGLRRLEFNLNLLAPSGFDGDFAGTDGFLRRIAFVAAGLGFGLLYWASVQAQLGISVALFSAVTALFLIPSALAIFYHTAIAGRMDEDGRHVQHIMVEVSGLVTTFDRDILPQLQSIDRRK